jgi:hypothetical protein
MKPMSDFDEFCKRLGVSLHRGPAAIAYAEANDLGSCRLQQAHTSVFMLLE